MGIATQDHWTDRSSLVEMMTTLHDQNCGLVTPSKPTDYLAFVCFEIVPTSEGVSREGSH